MTSADKEISNTALFGRISMALGLFASAIKSGECWSNECEQARTAAWDALGELGKRIGPGDAGADKELAEIEKWSRGAYEKVTPDDDYDNFCTARAHVVALLRILKSRPAAQGWQPIETAPEEIQALAKHTMPRLGDSIYCILPDSLGQLWAINYGNPTGQPVHCWPIPLPMFPAHSISAQQGEQT